MSEPVIHLLGGALTGTTLSIVSLHFDRQKEPDKTGHVFSKINLKTIVFDLFTFSLIGAGIDLDHFVSLPFLAVRKPLHYLLPAVWTIIAVAYLFALRRKRIALKAFLLGLIGAICSHWILDYFFVVMYADYELLFFYANAYGEKIKLLYTLRLGPGP
jgi:membrane-bound metal-dependent hydrolase YbcI (DUF457 family)